MYNSLITIFLLVLSGFLLSIVLIVCLRRSASLKNLAELSDIFEGPSKFGGMFSPYICGMVGRYNVRYSIIAKKNSHFYEAVISVSVGSDENWSVESESWDDAKAREYGQAGQAMSNLVKTSGFKQIRLQSRKLMASFSDEANSEETASISAPENIPRQRVVAVAALARSLGYMAGM